ncbi:flavodoxin family protein [Ectopseudomonas khazarica]|uniref:flavodoxin family protein n=1 Tax=Ectopseudomonas khazarica TaxID=2502979 RepID=UPI00056B10CB
MFKWIALLLGVPIAVVMLELLAVTWIESLQARQLASRQPEVNPQDEARTAVVYFSRSGNTALAARQIARHLDARLFALEAPAYSLGLSGLLHALKDAYRLKERAEALPQINPSNIDLTSFDTVWLGSPVWLYSPAPPLWSFVEHNRFDDQHIVLFNTYNSNFGDEHIERLKAKLMARGARSFEHRHIQRGRMSRQTPPEQMLHAIEEQWFNGQTSP